MVEPDDSHGPLAFSARFPREEPFAATAAELASRLAGTAGCVSGAAGEVRAAVEEAFRRALAMARPEDETVDLALRASDDEFSAVVTCGSSCVLHWTRSRVAPDGGIAPRS